MNKKILVIFVFVFLFSSFQLDANRKKKRLLGRQRTFSHSGENKVLTLKIYTFEEDSPKDLDKLTGSPGTPGTPTLGDFFPENFKILQDIFRNTKLNEYIDKKQLNTMQIFSNDFLQKICNLSFEYLETESMRQNLTYFYPDAENVFFVAYVIVRLCDSKDEQCQALMKIELLKFFEDIEKIFTNAGRDEDWQDQAKKFIELIFPAAVAIANQEFMFDVKDSLDKIVRKLLEIYNPNESCE